MVLIIIIDMVEEKLLIKVKFVSWLCFCDSGSFSIYRLGLVLVGSMLWFMMVMGRIRKVIVNR